MMLTNPQEKYQAFQGINLPNRQWPSNPIRKAPIWMSTDLRDGNQALFEPMNITSKLQMFNELIKIGFKEIEVGFPSASETEFTFIRTLIDDGHIPDDVTIEVLTQSRDHLIEKTIAAVKGIKRVIIHYYNATAPTFRKTVFGQDKEGIKQIAISGAKKIQELTIQHPETEWTLQYSPEAFSGTELEFAKEICDAVIDIWCIKPGQKVILNLPATVELASPNVYADQIEWMHQNLKRRDCAIISVHPHNDRGTAVAAAELALMAGAQRVEGCLFGNGERTGNVDLVTLALNLYTQGISPNLDFSHLNDIARMVEECTQIPVHPRHPYVGDLVFTAFSGSHQDAIKKGMQVQKDKPIWDVPYLAIDPIDIGRTYDSIIRVNSQSGKGGAAYLMEQHYGIKMPRRLQVEFGNSVQQLSDNLGTEVFAKDIWQLFEKEYLALNTPIQYINHALFEMDEIETLSLTLKINNKEIELSGQGNGPIDALFHAIQTPIKLHSYNEHSIGSGSNTSAVCYTELVSEKLPGTTFGVAINANIITASIKSIICGLNRIYLKLPNDTSRKQFLTMQGL